MITVMTETEKNLRRLAVLEGMTFTTWDQVLEWYHLRRWVLAYDLLDQYHGHIYIQKLSFFLKGIFNGLDNMVMGKTIFIE